MNGFESQASVYTDVSSSTANGSARAAPGRNDNGPSGPPDTTTLIAGVFAAPFDMASYPDSSEGARLLKNVIGGAVHDFSNLLSVIGFDLDMLESEWLSTEGAQAVSSLRSEIKYLKDIALELRMAAADVATSARVPQTRLAAWWPDMRALLCVAYRDGVVVTADIPWGLPAVGIPARHLTQIVLNLAGNSAHAITDRLATQNGTAAKRGEIRVSARLAADDRTMELTIADDGAGMTPEVVRRACEPYFTTRASVGGSGLGLPLVRRLLDQAGGEFRITSAVDTGTSVTLELPIRRD